MLSFLWTHCWHRQVGLGTASTRYDSMMCITITAFTTWMCSSVYMTRSQPVRSPGPVLCSVLLSTNAAWNSVSHVTCVLLMLFAYLTCLCWITCSIDRGTSDTRWKSLDESIKIYFHPWEIKSDHMPLAVMGQ